MGKTINVSPFTSCLDHYRAAFDLIVAATLLLSTLPLALGVEWARPAGIATLVLMWR